MRCDAKVLHSRVSSVCSRCTASQSNAAGNRVRCTETRSLSCGGPTLRETEEAIRANDQALASAAILRYGDGSKRGQVPLCKAPYGPFRQRYLTPF